MQSNQNSRQSEFLRALGRYHRPRAGETIITKHGEAKISLILSYAGVVGEMEECGMSGKDIEEFKSRVGHFFGNKRSRYFECELEYPDGETGRIDWSEYLAMKNGKKR